MMRGTFTRTLSTFAHSQVPSSFAKCVSSQIISSSSSLPSPLLSYPSSFILSTNRYSINTLHTNAINQPSFIIKSEIPKYHNTEDDDDDVIGASINKKREDKNISEDACFLHEHARVLAVFDGVGGWAEEKVDPSAFPRELEVGLRSQVEKLEEKRKDLKKLRQELLIGRLSKEVLSESVRKEKEDQLIALSKEIKDLQNPQKLMEFAHSYAKKKVPLGSSTACIAVLEPAVEDIDLSSSISTPTHSRSSSSSSLSSAASTPPPSPLVSRHSNASSSIESDMKGKAILHTANLGDSGWLLYSARHGKIIEKSEEQQHVFNMPYQLGAGKVRGSDSANDAQIAQTTVEYGDIIILCTDGLLDNLDENEISSTVHSNYGSHLLKGDLEVIANKLFEEAKQKFGRRVDTPFRRRIIEHYQKSNPKLVAQAARSFGGKEDDVCVVVAQYQDPRMHTK